MYHGVRRGLGLEPCGGQREGRQCSTDLFHIREPRNEPILQYAPGSREREGLKAELQRMLANPVEVPCIIGGREVHTGDLVDLIQPHNHRQPLGRYHRASARGQPRR